MASKGVGAGANFPSRNHASGELPDRHRRDNKEATALLEDVCARKPTNVTALSNLAQLYAEANQIEKAAELDCRVVEIEPHSLEMWVIRAQHLRMLGRKEESQAAFRRAIELNPAAARPGGGSHIIFRLR